MLCGKGLSEFIQILMDHNIHWAEYTNEHKEQDGETIEFILKKMIKKMKAICNTSPIIGLSIKEKIKELKPLIELLISKKFRISKKIINQLLEEQERND